jgi:hypothetical protein
MAEEPEQKRGVLDLLRSFLAAVMAFTLCRSGLLDRPINAIKRWLGFSAGAPGGGAAESPASQDGAGTPESGGLPAASRRVQDSHPAAQAQGVDRKALLAMHGLSGIGSIISMANAGAGAGGNSLPGNHAAPRPSSREGRD